jgi:hypothetical protein
MNFSPYAFSLRQLQYIVAVADLLSFNRAADECHVSQPSLSLQIAESSEYWPSKFLSVIRIVLL